ncbi:DNA-binding protein Fis [Candidatus Koribacter versatilis Ellin345]|uniref:DNA-binding protein Fis n=1 Tax=Koribacter versatilis (strain Ellin345) TaxID=204669 RepID=Q1IK50_KORVE|nr:sigma 54-interacting transcriptional regulator [Candidatus Koribacter versatilis]ABF42750.1 DNA-binding protein Fis [Candidatus Koribacter versatilis Ellin345]
MSGNLSGISRSGEIFGSILLIDPALARPALVQHQRVGEIHLRTSPRFNVTSSEIPSFEGIVGSSSSLSRALDRVMTVAPTDATVLIHGETGTGKELIAQAVHRLGRRRNGRFVRFNCAAIPLGLLESELFGHEKGAFTGAVARKIGRFELANNGTLFLDEIGDIPLELQAKLLRVLQEREFERLGSNQTLHVNVRLIAASHRDLRQMVREGKFREDLFYRLNIFPITVPALRERRDDIPALIRYFAEDCVRRLDRRVNLVPLETVRALTEYDWPGNIRELQNFMERSVILSQGVELQAPLDDLRWSKPVNGPETQTLSQAEYGHILSVLKTTNWVVGGPAGAALKLGLKRTTLIGKMRKLGLSRSREASVQHSGTVTNR